MQYKIESVALHLTNECSHACPTCYATDKTKCVEEGNLETLKKILLELRNAEISEVNFVGGILQPTLKLRNF